MKVTFEAPCFCLDTAALFFGNLNEYVLGANRCLRVINPAHLDIIDRVNNLSTNSCTVNSFPHNDKGLLEVAIFYIIYMEIYFMPSCNVFHSVSFKN